MDKANIIYVEGSNSDRVLIENIFKYDYRFVSCNINVCLDQAIKNKPDLFIIEIDDLSIEKSLELVRHIRQKTEANPSGLILVSNNTGEDLRIKYYNAGADDFIGKPYDIHHLVYSVKLILSAKEAERKLLETKKSSNKLISTSIRSLGEQGTVMRFVQDSMNLDSYSALAKEVFKALDNLGLHGALAIWLDKDTPFYSHGNVTYPIENDILSVAHEKHGKKIQTFQNRCLILGKHTTLLIRDLSDDLETSGRHKDMLAMLIDSLDMKCSQVSMTDKLVKSELQLTQAMLLTSQSISILKKRTVNSREKVKNAIDGLTAQLEADFMSMGLTEEQEELLISRVSEAENLIDSEITESFAQEEEMEKILKLSSEVRWQSSK